MSDVVTPTGQTVVSDGHGHSHNHDRSFEAALISQAGEHRTSLQLATESRFNARDSLDQLKGLADLEARTADRFSRVLNAIKEEAGRTREAMLQQKTDDLRFANLRLEIAAK